MSNRGIQMYEYRQIILHLRSGESDRAITRSGLAGRIKIKQVREIASQQGWLNPDRDVPTDTELLSFFRNNTAVPSNESKAMPYAKQIEQWHRDGVQATTIYQALVRNYKFDGSYNSILRFIKKIKKSTADVTVPLSFKPSEAAQVDFGQGPIIVDPISGKGQKSWFFVMTLCYSRHQYAELVLNQSVETWLGCHRRAFEWFGGVVAKVIIDNPKCAITKACYYKPTVQRSYGDYAQVYGFIISPCPVRDPQKKGRVESGVKYVKNNFMPLRHFRSLAEANKQLKDWVLEQAGNRTHGSTFEKPLTRFAEMERDLLKPLPDVAPEAGVWADVTVYRDCHVRYLKCHYSAPYLLVGQTLSLRATETSVRLYQDHELIAIHPRRTKPGDPSTLAEHLPPAARDYLEHDATWCTEQAVKIGACCQQVVEQLLDDKIIDYLRAAQGIICLEKEYGSSRLNAACKRALLFNSPEYKTIQTILKKGLEYSTLPDDKAFNELAEVYSGGSRFCRQIKDLQH